MNIRTLIRILSHSLFPAVFLLLQACFVGDYLGAYFNTFYNASRLFTEAEQEILNQPAPKQQDTVYLRPFNAPASAKTKLTSVVEKCSKLLQYHPESNLVDDALMMIGKAYYYQDELQKAERKFAELLSNTSDEKLQVEARLYLAFTFYRMNEKDSAYATALPLADSTGGVDADISARAFGLIGHIESESNAPESAEEAFRFAARLADSSEDQAFYLLKAAEIQERQGMYEAALGTYREASDAATSYPAIFRAEVAESQMLVKLARYDEALDLLSEMRGNNNHREFFGEIELQIGDTHNAAGNIDDAIAQYRFVDTTYVRTEVSANGYYQLGLLYETQLKNYDSALVAYNSGKSQAPQAPVTKSLTTRAGYLSRYRTLTREIAKFDSLQQVLLNPKPVLTISPDSTVMDSTIATSDSPFADSIASKQNSGTQVAVGPPPNPDSVSAGLAKNIAELAGLFYSSLSVLDSAKYWYDVLLRDHPESQFTPIALYTLAQIASQDSSTSAAMLDSLYRLIIDRYPTSEFADASREILGLSPKEESADEAGGLYERGEQLLNRDSADAAIALFRQIAAYYPESPLAPKAQYAIGWIYEQVYDDADSAIANYERLVTKFPSTPYAVEVSAKLQAVRAGQGGTSQGGPQEDMTPPSPPQPPTQPGGLPPGKTTPLSRPQDPELAEPDTLMEDEPLEEPDPR